MLLMLCGCCCLLIRDDGEEGKVCEHDGSYILIGDTETPDTGSLNMNMYSCTLGDF